MFDFTKDISSEIVIIYGLIIFIVVLIASIIIFDKREKKKRFITRTQELRLMDLRKTEEDYTGEFKKQPLAHETELRSIEPEPQIVEVMASSQEEVLADDAVVKTENIVAREVDSVSSCCELLIDEEQYVEDDLEKTSAQLQLELLAQELEKAKESEEVKIAKFEAEQEENAIISYNELLKVCDELYDKNEKVQYMDEGNEPINLEELRNRFQKVTASDAYSCGGEVELLD